MKASLQFNIPDDEGQYKAAIYGMDFYCALLEIQNTIRGWNKGYETDPEKLIERISEAMPWQKMDEIP